MTKKKIKWKVYHDYLTFFILYPGLWDHVFGRNFIPYKQFQYDWNKNKNASDPQRIIIEPTYQDAPHINHRPNDNHAPLAIGWGENFLRGVYESVIFNKTKWDETGMIIYYDDQEAIYHHVTPPLIPYSTPAKSHLVINSRGQVITTYYLPPLLQNGSVLQG